MLLNFIVVDTDNHTVKLYNEREYLEETGLRPLKADEFNMPADRIEELVASNSCEVAWCRDDAISVITDEIELLSAEDGDDEEIAALARMIIEIAKNNWWDDIIDGS